MFKDEGLISHFQKIFLPKDWIESGWMRKRIDNFDLIQSWIWSDLGHSRQIVSKYKDYDVSPKSNVEDLMKTWIRRE